uniref:GB1/RHD3-type G domain-containing protein n=1 Tax=Panagrolaimus superbus TaxID=310955 RepID=A0A914Y443_9BILA
MHKEQHPNEPWQLTQTTKLAGFEFREGEDRTTLGIWAWNRVFIIQQNDGKKVAVSLIDSQGTFDNHTTYQDCSTIFAMTCMFSSVMCFNVFTDLQEDKLNDLATFVDHAKKIVDNLGGNGKLFQDLAFIVRDCCFNKYLEDKNGGQKYIEKVLSEVKVQERQEVRDSLNASYERKFGFVFPHPGKQVALKKTSKISEMDSEFVEKTKEMVETLLSPAKLSIKQLGPVEFCCKDMCSYIPLCVQCFDENQEFAPQAVQTVNRDFVINKEVQRAIEKYIEFLEKVFVNCKTGYDQIKMDEFHMNAFTCVQNDILKRIKSKAINDEIMKIFVKQANNKYVHYFEKNQLLVEVRHF